MKIIKLKILSWLLQQANTYPMQNLYEIKNIILSKHGKFIDYQLQKFPEKECYRCEGSGKFYVYETAEYVDCLCCGATGIYKPEKWVLLKVIQFGKYQFHSPERSGFGKWGDSEPVSLNIIYRRIIHKTAKWYIEANLILHFLYKKPIRYRIGTYRYNKNLTPVKILDDIVFSLSDCYNAIKNKIQEYQIDIRNKFRDPVDVAKEYEEFQDDLPF
jgi:hypothetical protein